MDFFDILSCNGCYASSDKNCKATLTYPVLDRIMEEAQYKFGMRFITISGGEPFLYKDDNKTLLDIFKKYNDIFFLVYTNGTLISPDVAYNLKESGNVTPAVSVEGFEKETDRRRGGYIYIDWDGNITPCVFIPYAADNIYELYDKGKSLTDALFSDFMKNGREWQNNYGLNNKKAPCNWLMPCSIRDHYDNFRKKILTEKVKSINREAEESLDDKNYYKGLIDYDNQLKKLTAGIWRNEYINDKR